MLSARGVLTDGAEIPPCGVRSLLFQGVDIVKHRVIYRKGLAERLVLTLVVEFPLLFKTISGRQSKLFQ